MRDYRTAGILHTNAWSSPSLDPNGIWSEAEDRLMGRVPDVSHH
jgi:hypothetical protein